MKIPEVLDLLNFLYKLQSEDNHREINNLRLYLLERWYYIEGSTFIIKYIINNCTTYNINCRSTLKREPVKQIITYYPKERYVRDLSDFHVEFKKNNKYIYLFSIIDHFSKYGMAYIIYNKNAETTLKYIKIAFECNGFPESIGCDNGIKFNNNLVDNFLSYNDINKIKGAPNNPHSQGVVKRLHQTLKDLLCCIISKTLKILI